MKLKQLFLFQILYFVYICILFQAKVADIEALVNAQADAIAQVQADVEAVEAAQAAADAKVLALEGMVNAAVAAIADQVRTSPKVFKIAQNEKF